MLEDTEGKNLKIIDFGFAKNVAPSHLKKWGFYEGEHLNCKAILGTAKYASPEILDGEVYDGMKSDMWACGVILFTMLECRYPFDVGDSMGVGGNTSKCVTGDDADLTQTTTAQRKSFEKSLALRDDLLDGTRHQLQP